MIETVIDLIQGALAGAWGLLPQACALCASSSRDSKAAYLGTTVLLLAVPAGLLSALILWLIRRAR